MLSLQIFFSIRRFQKTRISAASIIRREDRKFGTVGVVALDKSGNLVAGTSTCGVIIIDRYGNMATPFNTSNKRISSGGALRDFTRYELE